MPIFSIEGNIGSGKSTLIEKIKHASPEILLVQEPVDAWGTFKDPVTGETILEKYYKNRFLRLLFFNTFEIIWLFFIQLFFLNKNLYALIKFISIWLKIYFF